MKLLNAAAIAAAALTLCACSMAPNVKLDAGKALLVAEASVDGANNTAKVIAASNPSVAKAKTVKAAIDAANPAVDAAHALYTKGDLGGAVTALQTAFTNIAIVEGAK